MVCGSRSVALIETSNNLKTDSAIFAHEVAHLIGADHDGQGEQATCPNTGNIMSPNLSGLGLTAGECNTAWVGDGYCDVRCMKYNADGGDCAQQTHDDAGNPLMAGYKPKDIVFSKCSERDINDFIGRGPTCLLQEGNPHTMENSASMVGVAVFDKCNTAWVGDGYCDFRCVKYANDGGDCDGRTTDHSGNALTLGGTPDTMPQTQPQRQQQQPQIQRQIPQQKVPQMQQQLTEECNTQWVGDGVCDHRCVKYQNDGGDCNGRTTDSAGYPLPGMGGSMTQGPVMNNQRGYNPWSNVMQQFSAFPQFVPARTMGGRGRG